MSQTQTSLLLLGAGYVGGSLLQSLLASNKYKITVLIRGEDRAEILKGLGVKPLIGSLDDEELLAKAATEHDIIINTSSSDHVPSVRALLKGLADRPATSPPAVFIHTSGCGVLLQGTTTGLTSSHVFSDARPAEIDAVPDAAMHRDVDLLIKHAVESGDLKGARVSVIIPPLTFGTGTGPFNRLTIAVPMLIKAGIAAKEVVVPGGDNSWSSIHVLDLVSAYEVLLADLLASPASTSPNYVFAESGSVTWLDFSRAVHKTLRKRELVKPEMVVQPYDGGILGSSALCEAVVLRQKGWAPVQKQTVVESVEGDFEEMKRVGAV